jgi:hypothetical protein
VQCRADQEHLPVEHLWAEVGMLWASASLHHAHLGLPALTHPHAMTTS